MKTPVLLASLCVGGVSALQIGIARASPVVMNAVPPAGFEWGYSDVMDECMVDAENAAEQAACMGEDAPAAVTSKGSVVPSDGVVNANAKEMKMGYNAKSLDECLVDAENLGEVQECNEDFDELISGK